MKEKQVKKQWEEQSRALVAKSFAPGGQLEHFDKQPVAAQVMGIAALLESAIAERDWLIVVVAQQALQKTIAVAKVNWPSLVRRRSTRRIKEGPDVLADTLEVQGSLQGQARFLFCYGPQDPCGVW